PAVVRVGERNVSPLSPARGCSARRRLPSRGSLGPPFPTFLGTLRRSDCHRVPLGALRLSRASRYLACFRRSWSPLRARGRAPAPGPARALGHPVPHSGYCTRRHVALPRSHVPPLARIIHQPKKTD